MNLLLLGHGKTGKIVAELGRERGYSLTVLTSAQNQQARALTPEALAAIEVVVDFTNPDAVLQNIAACLRARKNMVVGTTGWHAHLPDIRRQVAEAGTGFVYGSNFSIGMNVFFGIARAASAALGHGYQARLVERHHAQKKDKPSGTALRLRELLESGAQSSEAAGEIEITSIREGDAVGQHVIILDSDGDTLMLVHDAKSRRAFAEGALLAAEWIRGKTGFFEFGEVLSHSQR